MQLSFNPMDLEECVAVRRFLDVLDANAADAYGVIGITQTPAPDVGGQDQRDPAAAFGASAAPLVPPALFTAGATQSPSAPAGVPAGLPVSLPGMSAAAQLPGAMASAVPGNATPAANPAGTVDLDKNGLPWDARIHASTKSKTKDGAWTKLRGFNDEAKYNAIVAELRAAVALPPAGAVAAAPAQMPAMPMPLPTMGAAAAPMAAPAMQPGTSGPVSSAVPAQPAATLPASSTPQNFDELMPRITAAQTAQQIPAGALEAALTAFQMPGVISLVSRPDYVPHVWDYLKKQYPALV